MAQLGRKGHFARFQPQRPPLPKVMGSKVQPQRGREVGPTRVSLGEGLFFGHALEQVTDGLNSAFDFLAPAPGPRVLRRGPQERGPSHHNRKLIIDNVHDLLCGHLLCCLVGDIRHKFAIHQLSFWAGRR